MFPVRSDYKVCHIDGLPCLCADGLACSGGAVYIEGHIPGAVEYCRDVVPHACLGSAAVPGGVKPS